MTNRPTIIFIDDEERIVRSLAVMFKGPYQVVATTNPREVLDVVKRERVHLVVSDQRMPEVVGVDLLREVRALSPLTMRVLLTGYSDLAAIVGSINDGEIFRFVSKPWDQAEFRSTVDSAVAIATELFEQSKMPASIVRTITAATTTAEVLVIDDSEEVYRVVEQILGSRYRIRWASTIEAAFECIESGHTGVIISDVKIGGVDSSIALKGLKRHAPHLVTVVLAWFHDTKQLVELINQAQIFRFLPKPVRPTMLEMAVDAAMTRHLQLHAQPVLARAYAVEPASEPPPAPSSRMASFLSRLKQRLSPERQVH
jgi:DNA-binding NtrC family response regulator